MDLAFTCSTMIYKQRNTSITPVMGYCCKLCPRLLALSVIFHQEAEDMNGLRLWLWAWRHILGHNLQPSQWPYLRQGIYDHTKFNEPTTNPLYQKQKMISGEACLPISVHPSALSRRMANITNALQFQYTRSQKQRNIG